MTTSRKPTQITISNCSYWKLIYITFIVIVILCRMIQEVKDSYEKLEKKENRSE